MKWVIDGSNVLGALRWNRESRDAKEKLVTLCARFARAWRKKVILCFDGSAPPAFAKKLGGLTVRFAHPRAADEVIADATRDESDSWTVVTSDADLANRIRRRRVHVCSSREFIDHLTRIDDDRDGDLASAVDDWSDYFSDPNNRIF